MARIDAHEWITIASCAGHLALATIALLRISRSPLAWPLALLCLDFFAFNAADVAGHLTGAPEWIWLDAFAASLLGPLALQFALSFVGRSQTLKALLGASYLYFGFIALGCAAAFFGISRARAFAGSPLWAEALFPGALVTVLALFYLFISHLRASHSPLERARTWLVIGGFALGTAGSLSDLLADAAFDVPRLGPLGTLLTTLALTVVALRLGLFDRRISWLLAANGLIAGTLQICAYLAVFRFFGGNSALLTLGTGTLTLALVPALAAMSRAASTHRQRLEYHATLGRFSAQMAHDLRNPLAAIKGAAQYLREEQARGEPPADSSDYLELIVEQANRLDRVIADYQRIGRIEPVLQTLDVNALVERTLDGQDLAAPAGVAIHRRLAASLPSCQADRDLIASALENLVRNAFDALPGGGAITVETEQRESEPRHVRISVSDTGAGMDARLAERVFGDFFTTKASGSGLGLAFVKRVAEAHGGDATLTSEEGKGTTVRMRLPISN